MAGDEPQDAESRRYSTLVGERIRAVRVQQRLSLQAVEKASDYEFKASVLGAYERGERAISVPRLYRLARFYNVPVSQLLPRDESAAAQTETEPGTESLGSLFSGPSEPRAGGQVDRRASKMTVDLTKLNEVDLPERDLMKRYLEMIQVRRQDFNGRVLTIRAEDVVAIACLFQLTADEMARRLIDVGVIQPRP
jgi:transcriptional regulator with XRE-family HTH domain